MEDWFLESGPDAEYERTLLVQKLKVARYRKKVETGKCEGRKSYREVMPQTVHYISRLRRKREGIRKRTYKEIADILNAEGIPTLKWPPLESPDRGICFARMRLQSIAKMGKR